MVIWIVLGVAAIVLVAVLARLLFGGAGKRRTPLVSDEHQRRESKQPSSVEEPPEVAASPVLLSDEFRSNLDNVSGNRIADGVAASVSDDGSSAYRENSSGIGTNRISSTSNHSIFSEFHGIVNSSDDRFSIPDPEDLPIDEEELTFGSATPALAQMLPESTRRKGKQRQNLQAAGYHSRASWLNLNSVRFVFAFLALALVGLGLIVAPPVAEPYLLAAVAAAPLVGWALPPLFVASQAEERRLDVERALPDALDILNMGVSQGLPVQSSLRRIGPEIAPAHPVLAQELKIVDQQAQVGSLNHALHNFAKRMDSNEVNSFTSLLIQSEATGTSVSQALTDYSDSMRSTMRERADSRANAASFKLLFPTVLCLMPSVFMFLLGPAIVSLSDFANNTANDLLESRDNAINTLDQGQQVVRPDQ
jgi:Flp pilus assembly protein TadB